MIIDFKKGEGGKLILKIENMKQFRFLGIIISASLKLEVKFTKL